MSGVEVEVKSPNEVIGETETTWFCDGVEENEVNDPCWDGLVRDDPCCISANNPFNASIELLSGALSTCQNSH